ncbi:hypothetical protein TNCV_4496081 [Trichonephila clavipes]|nr:hypothetical protein TNCV_4496081 [Trichonephila clavipes]
MKRPNKKAGANLPLSSSLINYAHMVWTISLEEFLINGGILQGSKDLQLSNLILRSEKELNFDHSSLEFLQGAPHSKKPTKEHLFRILIVAAMFQKRRPCNSQTKGLETIAILSR